ncbi:helix-turn-helix domain-containing protein [Lentzea flaviverrucosa]|uniref:Helix-turn-helix domain-containing protein n=1 Tax=Lentzea flaviverrucosa TaxID=200379 RepID=A0A1H9XNK3_9PSEU|nr:helix-turn-helix domain-containing protein [Lentzea flaviverrucosa]RDI19659.1 helix-turn-helix protein [Lentzea flaviverrucosa]SES47736.1 Helix-turn-helix domain-containing protein [Lentzea flaviverrucosa]
MSIESIVWALNDAPIPRDRRDASSLTVVLLGLANHADPFGRNAFPSLGTLTRYTRLSERSVRYAIRALEDLGLIRPADPDIVAAYVKRADRRPNGYDLAIERREPVHNSSGGQTLPPADQHGGQAAHERGASGDATGGKHCPRTVLNPSKNRPSRERAPEARSRPECGQCDARPGDPISARVVWLDADRVRSTPCPICSPAVTR